MAYNILNPAAFPTEAVPTFSKQHADGTSVAATDTGIAGLKFIRVRIKIKSGMSNTNTVLFAVRVGTGASVGSPELVATSPTYTFVTNDTNLMVEVWGYSEAGFQSYKVDATNSGGAASFDAKVDCF